MQAVVTEWRARRFRDFTGAEVDGRVPFTEPVINELIDRVVLPRAPSLRRLRVTVRPENRLDVFVLTRRVWLPGVTIPLEIEPDLVFTPDPTIRISIRRQGLVGEMAPLLGLVAERLPPGVRVQERLIDVNLAVLLPEGDPQLVLSWLKRARIETTTGTIWLEARLVVGDDGQPVMDRDTPLPNPTA